MSLASYRLLSGLLALTFAQALAGCSAKISTAPNPPSNSLPVSMAPLSSTLKVVATISIGPFPTSIALDPALHRAYVTTGGEGDVKVVNLRSNTVIDTIRVGLDPVDVAVDPKIHRAYVMNAYVMNDDVRSPKVDSANIDTVTVISTRTDKVIATIKVGNNPRGVALDPAAHRAYVLNSGIQNVYGTYNGTVSIINTLTDAVIRTIPIGKSFLNIGIDPGLHRLYLSNGGNKISVINTVTETLMAHALSVGSSVAGVTIDPATHRVYALNMGTNTITVIDTINGSVLGTVLVSGSPSAMALDPALQRAYVADRSPIQGSNPEANDGICSQCVAKLNPSTVSVLNMGEPLPKDIGFVDVGIGPVALAVDPLTHRLYVVNVYSDTVSVIGPIIRAHPRRQRG